MLVFVTIFYTAATFALAYYAYKNFQAAEADREASEEFRSQQRKASEEFRCQLSDLYQAMAIATMLSSGQYGEFEKIKSEFVKMYDGKVVIFKGQEVKAS